MTISRQYIFSFIMISISLYSCKNNHSKSEIHHKNSEVQNLQNTHNSQNSLDWTGTYIGVLPCADCAGIETEIELNSDLSYKKITRYLGKSSNSFESEGTFIWDDSGSKVILQDEAQPNSYQVIENAIIALDSDQKLIDGDLKSYYKLDKKF